MTRMNQVMPANYVGSLGAVLGEMPVIAQRVWQGRPFAHASGLH